MSRRTLLIVLTAIATVSTIATLAAPSFAGGCHVGYGYRSCHTLRPVYVAPVRLIQPVGIAHNDARQMFLLMQARPELVRRFPVEFATLQKQFAVAPAVVPVRQTIVEKTVITPAAAPVQVTAPAVAPIGGPAPVAAPVGGPAPIVAPAVPSGIPTDLPPAAPGNAAPGNIAPVNATAAVPAELQPLLGLWKNVLTGDDGQENVTTLNLEANGNATLTVNAPGIGPVSVKRPFGVEDGQFLLKGDQNLVLGKVVSADKDQVVLNRDGVQLEFNRP